MSKLLLMGALLVAASFSLPATDSARQKHGLPTLTPTRIVQFSPAVPVISTPVLLPVKPANFSAKCKTGGCSGELCHSASEPDQVSTCIYRKEYACLAHSRCEVQPNGLCGWTQTPEYLNCLKGI